MAGTQNDAGEVGGIDGIGEALGFQRYSLARLGQVFPGIYLEAGSIRRHNQAVPGFRVKKDGGDFVARFGIQHVVVVQSGGGGRGGGGVAFPQQGCFPQVKVRSFHGKNTAVGDIGRVHRSIGGGPYLQGHGINGGFAGQVPVSVVGEVDDCGRVRIRFQAEMKGFFHHGVGGYHFQVAGVIFLTVCGVQGQHQRIAPGFLHLPDFAVKRDIKAI